MGVTIVFVSLDSLVDNVYGWSSPHVFVCVVCLVAFIVIDDYDDGDAFN